MIAVNDDQELFRIFSQLLLLGNIFSPREFEQNLKGLKDLLEKCGIAIIRSECEIVDRSKVGESLITIARYSIEYRKKEQTREKRVVLEGGLAIEEDRFGNLNIRIRNRSSPFLSEFDAFRTKAMVIGNGITRSSPIIPPPIKP